MPKYLSDFRDNQAEELSKPDPTVIVGSAAKMQHADNPDFKAPPEPTPGTMAEGWRCWKVDLELPPFGLPPKLNSVTHSFFWTPKKLARAECRRDDSHVPGEACRCGFYSAKTLRHLQGMGYIAYNPDHGVVTIVGRVANWGKVIEGSQGWRAEKSYPVQLFVPFEAYKLAKPLADTYGVPVKLMNLLDRGATP
jgi:hypothetical protein